MGFKFDTVKDGFQTVMRGYQEICLRFIWEKKEEGVTSGTAWVHVNNVLMEQEKSISRASIIMFLNDMFKKGVVRYTEESGKGGYHRIYSPVFDEEGFKRHVAEKVISKLSEMWPDATREVLNKSLKLGN